MKKRQRQPFRSNVTPEAQRRSVTETPEFRKSAEQSQRDRLGLQDKFRTVDEELEEHDQVTQLTRGYLHARIDSGVVDVKGVLGLEVADVGFEVTVAVSDDQTLATPYSVTAANQLDLSNARFYSGAREADGFTVRETNALGVAVDMSVGVHEFSVLALGSV